MNLDGLTLSVLIRELNDQVGNGQIQRIQQIDKTSILLKINTHHKSILSDYCRQCSIHLYNRQDCRCSQGAHISYNVFTEIH